MVLVRDMAALKRLPPALTSDNALVMTVPQSKGLEFNDVFLVGGWTLAGCVERRLRGQWPRDVVQKWAVWRPATVELSAAGDAF
jgi:hypothetical protein